MVSEKEIVRLRQHRVILDLPALIMASVIVSPIAHESSPPSRSTR